MKFSFHFFVRFIVISILLVFSLNATGATKIAVLTMRDAPIEAADLLTAEVSKLPNIETVERTQLERIFREQAFSRTSGADALKAAKLLGADAIVFLETVGATNVVLTWRLATTREGVILDANRLAWSQAEALRVAKSIATDIATLAAKVATPAGRAVKISTLNLRSPGSTAASEALDRELTRLLTLRLAREPELFVLERRKLADLAFEKELAATSEKFWTGSHLLDGTVNREGVSNDEVTLAIRLRAPSGEAHEVNSSGKRDQLADLVEKTVALILEKLRLASKADWNREREAAQHAEEADWALRWKMYDEAQAGADSAWALGLQTPEVASARALAYARDAAYPDANFVMSYSNVREPELGEGPVADPKKIEPLRVALAVCDATVANHPAWITNANWNRAVCETLSTSGDLLKSFYWDKKARQPAELTEVREISRSIGNRAIAIPEMKRMFWIDPQSPPLLQDLDRFYEGTNIFATVGSYGAYFDETPEDTLAIYRLLISGDAFPYIRQEILAVNGRYPMMGGKITTRRRASELWPRFVDELRNATNAILAVEGELFGLLMLPNLAEVNSRLMEVHKRFVMNAPILKEYKAPPHLENALHNLAIFGQWNTEKSPPEDFVFRNDRLDFGDNNVRQQIMLRQAKRLEPRVREMWTQLKPYDRDLMEWTIPGVQEPPYAKELLPLAEEYLAKGTNTAGVFRGDEITLFNDKVRFLRAVANRPTPEEAFRKMKERQAAMLARIPTNRPAVKPAPATNSNVFVIELGDKQYVRFGEREWQGNGKVSQPIFRDGRLWFLVSDERYEQPQTPDGFPTHRVSGRIASVDPRDGAYHVYDIPVRNLTNAPVEGVFPNYEHSRRPYRHIFDVTANDAFIVQNSELHRLNLKSKRWTRHALPSSTADVYVVGERVFLSAEEAIYEITADASKTTVLASARRKPAVTVLDNLPAFGRPILFAGAGEAVRALLNGNAYEFGGKDWRQLTQFAAETKARVREGTVIFNVPQDFWKGEEMHMLRREDPRPTFLAANWPQRREGRAKWAERMKDARFVLPDFYVPGAHILVNGHPAFLGMRVGDAGDGIKAAYSFTIYDSSLAEPLVVPVAFDGMLPDRRGNFILADGRVWFAQTPDALCMGVPSHTGFWKISNAELERSIASARSLVAQKPQAAKP
jgi:curli biogenesis system outer membrane secretion channel CsgG